jgi:hypothetical protein
VAQESDMTQKLDPNLLAIAEEAQSSEGLVEVVVIVGLNAPAAPEDIAELQERGLATRSTIGDIVTGKIAIQNLSRLAECPLVKKVESSGPMFRE